MKNGFLFLVLIVALGCQKEEPVPAQREVFERVWTEFAETYPYFAHKGVDWDSIYQLYAPEFEGIEREEEAFAKMAQMLGSLRDIHINLNRPGQEFRYQKRDQFAANPPDNALHYLGSIHLDNKRVIYADVAGTDLAYLRIKTFIGSVNNYTQWPVETVVSSITQKAGLIIDLRDNPGGKEDFARGFAGRFMPDSRPYKYIRFRNGSGKNDFGAWQAESIVPIEPISFPHPIVLLTNRGCYSATESFVLMMQTLPQVTVIGDTTGGATGNPIAAHLPNGWRYTLPTWQAADLGWRLIEDRGIAPDLPLPMTESSVDAGQDLMLEAAMSLF
jgi:hypothetical protein